MPTVCFQVLHENHQLALLNYYEREIKSPPGITSHHSESKSTKVNKEYLWGGHGGEGWFLRHFRQGGGSL